MLKEFKEFINRGSVVDLAVGVIVGGAFSKIVTSLVNDMLMPLIGIIIGGHDFTGLSVTIGTATIKYGVFLQNIIDFLIVSICIFLIVKFMNKVSGNKKVDNKKESVPTKPDDVVLLTEIRDLLATKNQTKVKKK